MLKAVLIISSLTFLLVLRAGNLIQAIGEKSGLLKTKEERIAEFFQNCWSKTNENKK